MCCEAADCVAAHPPDFEVRVPLAPVFLDRLPQRFFVNGDVYHNAGRYRGWVGAQRAVVGGCRAIGDAVGALVNDDFDGGESTFCVSTMADAHEILAVLAYVALGVRLSCNDRFDSSMSVPLWL